MGFSDVTASVAKGVAAGAVGTAAVTAFQMVEMKLQDRGPSTAPAQAVERVLDVEAKGEAEERRLANLTHWAYGTGWGAVRGLLGATRLSEPAATLAFFALNWGSALGMLPSLDLAPNPKEWGAKELSVDALRHAVYAVAVSAAYDAMSD